MRIDDIPGAPAARLTDEQRGSIDVVWNGFRPLTSLEGLSGEQRAEAHRQNVARRKADLADYERFFDRFVADGRRCRTLDEIIAFGRPKLPDFPWERGGTMRENGDLASIHQRIQAATREALFDITKIRADIEKRRMPLDVQLEASVGVKAVVGGRSIGSEKSLTDDSTTGSYGAGPVTEKCRQDAAGKESCVTNVAGMSVSNRGVESLEATAGPTYLRASRETVALGVRAGPKISIGALSLRAEAKVGANVKLLDAETVRRALSNEDFWCKKP
jgi:hypothetical protein